MVDWLMKELISVCSYSDINEDRTCTKSVRINGRLYDKHGVDCATTAVALLYKVYDPSIKLNKYAVLIGIARQNPYDTVLNKEIGEEIAMENAMMNPVMQVEFPDEVDEQTLYNLMYSYILGLPTQFVKTRQEIDEEGKDLSNYNRNIRDDEYLSYYNDFKNIFFD